MFSRPSIRRPSQLVQRLMGRKAFIAASLFALACSVATYRYLDARNDVAAASARR
jgi:hypothetical protein